MTNTTRCGRIEDNIKLSREERAMVIIFLLYVLGAVAFAGAIIYVIAHFILKFW